MYQDRVVIRSLDQLLLSAEKALSEAGIDNSKKPYTGSLVIDNVLSKCDLTRLEIGLEEFSNLFTKPIGRVLRRPVLCTMACSYLDNYSEEDSDKNEIPPEFIREIHSHFKYNAYDNFFDNSFKNAKDLLGSCDTYPQLACDTFEYLSFSTANILELAKSSESRFNRAKISMREHGNKALDTDSSQNSLNEVDIYKGEIWDESPMHASVALSSISMFYEMAKMSVLTQKGFDIPFSISEPQNYLLVEDDKTANFFQNYFELHIANLSLHEIDTEHTSQISSKNQFFDAESAVSYIQAIRSEALPDIILSDINLGDGHMSGTKFARELFKIYGPNRNFKLFLFSKDINTPSTHSIVEELYRNGVIDGYFQKGTSLASKLETRINEMDFKNVDLENSKI